MMQRQAAALFENHGPGQLAGRWPLIFGGVFVLAWPAFNLLFVTLVLFQLGALDKEVPGGIALRIYATFGLAYVLIQILQRVFPLALAEEKFWPQLLLHVAAIFFIGQFFSPALTQTQAAQLPPPSVIPLVYTLFQITLFVLAKTLILQRERHLATQINLRQAQLNMLRSQINPHFLFNTLNSRLYGSTPLGSPPLGSPPLGSTPLLGTGIHLHPVDYPIPPAVGQYSQPRHPFIL